MMDTKADDDDDESFGEFTFASFPNHAFSSDQIKPPKRSDDDDEWGDFMETPTGSEPSGGFTNAQLPSKPFDPFGFFPDHSAAPSQSKPTRTEPIPKPKGALPLSIFGEEDQEEEQSGAPDPPAGDKPAGSVKNGSNMFIGLAFNDVVANLYNQSQQIKAENGLNSFKWVRFKANIDGLVSTSSGLNSDLSAGNNGTHSSLIKTESGLSSIADLFAGNYTSQSPKIKTGIGLSLNSGFFYGKDDAGSPEIKTVNELSSNSDLFAGKNHSQSSKIKPSNEFGLNWDLFAGKNDSQTPKIKAVNELSSNSDLFSQNNDSEAHGMKAESGLNSYSGQLNMNADLFSGNIVFDAVTNTYSESPRTEISNGLNSNMHESTANFRGKSANFDGFFSNSDPSGGNVDYDGDEDGWEFKDAYSEPEVAFKNDKVNGMDHANSKVTGFSSGLGNGSNGSIDLFSTSAGFSGKPQAVDIGFDFKPQTFAQTGYTSDSLFKSEEKSAKSGLISDPVVGAVDFGESFGDFHGSFTGTGLKEDNVVSDFPHSEVEELASDGKVQGNETISKNHKEALPLSIFGDEEQELGDSLKLQDAFTFETLPHLRNGINSQGSVISIHDLISNLYSQAEIPPVDKTEELVGNRLDSSNEVLNPSPVNCDDDFDDASWEFQDAPSLSGPVEHTSLRSPEKVNENLLYSDVLSTNQVNQDDDFVDASWEFKDASSTMNHDDDFGDASQEFKDASSQTTVVDQVSLPGAMDAKENFSTKLKLVNYLDFYYKLNDRLSFVCGCHLNRLKKAQNTAALSGEDGKAAAIEEEIQEACKKLPEENISSKNYSEDQLPVDISLGDLVEVLHEPKFQILESEYHLSRKLQLAEKDLKSAIELLIHTTFILNILTVGSMEDQSIYVSTWFKMISVCAQELKHGSWMWKQFVDNNLQSWILSEPRGKHFILALGEIYRVVLVLGASIKLYKPWVLSSSVNSKSIDVLLEECYTLWLSSGLEEALLGISDPIDFEYHSTVEALWESIKYIHDLDVLDLGNHVFNQKASVCQLSLLTSEAVPAMKMVFWNGDHYFLTLANLWGNLISCNPPELPHLRIGS
ncbi:uncharacterized protein LOC127801934 [Diospyros lotus]|uniref:uncharacterized protein LOC127801934 n=1 Tax=Diospyros lotus TaxID=55363 RepID=UPI002255BCE8|nr:uncharacterized protein LOC127801934 [Diospyros lotus]